jgi:GDP-L-fucose synthase
VSAARSGRPATPPGVSAHRDGSPSLHVDDLADACLHLLEHYDGPRRANVGTGSDVTIREIAETIAGRRRQ